MTEENKLNSKIIIEENELKRGKQETDFKLVYSSQEGKVFSKPAFVPQSEIRNESEEKEQGRTR